MTDAINIHHLNKWYGKYHALKNIDLNVKKGERLVICGPSGSGKSTLIRCINRLENYQEGEIRLDGELLTGSAKQTRDLRRKVGMVFQQFNLFPHLTILENLTLGPVWVNKQPRAQAEAVARQYLERVGIRDQGLKLLCVGMQVKRGGLYLPVGHILWLPGSGDHLVTGSLQVGDELCRHTTSGTRYEHSHGYSRRPYGPVRQYPTP